MLLNYLVYVCMCALFKFTCVWIRVCSHPVDWLLLVLFLACGAFVCEWKQGWKFWLAAVHMTDDFENAFFTSISYLPNTATLQTWDQLTCCAASFWKPGYFESNLFQQQIWDSSTELPLIARHCSIANFFNVTRGVNLPKHCKDNHFNLRTFWGSE